MKPAKHTLKIVVLGESYVGKTCLALRFCHGSVPMTPAATVDGAFFDKVVEVGDQRIKFQIRDTAGQERFHCIVPQYFRDVDGAIFVYDATDRDSFQNLPRWIEQFDEHHSSRSVPKMLVANKCDSKKPISVSTCEAEMFADSQNMQLFETSALDDREADTVNDIFLTIARKLKIIDSVSASTTKRFTVFNGIMQLGSNLRNGNFCC